MFQVWNKSVPTRARQRAGRPGEKFNFEPGTRPVAQPETRILKFSTRKSARKPNLPSPGSNPVVNTHFLHWSQILPSPELIFDPRSHAVTLKSEDKDPKRRIF